MKKATLAFLIVVAIGILDRLFSSVSTADSTVRRLGLHQDKEQAYWLYFFIAHIYDNILNPWHWTEAMRDQALVHADLCSECTVIDVGAGTGFTSIGVMRKGVSQLTMVDQSHAQLSKAAKKPELAGVTKLIGDAENLTHVVEYQGTAVVHVKSAQYDRYTSAGSIEYWPHPDLGIKEAFRVVKPGGRATIIGPVHPEHWISKIFADLWYLFPTSTEYKNWFQQAGFVDVRVEQITPDWYTLADRDHGLIMGFVVTGVRPINSSNPDPQPAPAPVAASNNVVRALLFLPRFVLGNIGGGYYAVLPVFIYAKNAFFCGSSLLCLLCLATFLLITLLPSLFLSVLPLSFTPYGNDKRLFNGIADFYNKSSGIWEQVTPHTAF